MSPPNGVPPSTDANNFNTNTATTDMPNTGQQQEPQTNICGNCNKNIDSDNNNEQILGDPPNNNINEKIDIKNMHNNESNRINGEVRRRDNTEEDDDYSEEYEEMIVPPDGGWGWVVTFASFMCNMVVDGIIFSFGLFLTDIAKHFNSSNTEAALIGSLLSGTYLFVGPFVSALANRFGFRAVTIAGSLLGSTAVCLSYFATGVGYLYVTYGIIGGIGFGLIYVPAVIAVGFYFEKWRAFATGIAVCGSGIGTFIMAPIFSSLIDTLGWQKTLLVQASFLLACIVFGCLFRPVKPTKVPISKIEQEIEREIEHEHEHETEHALLEQNSSKTQSMLSIHKTFGVKEHYPTVIEKLSKSSHSLHKSTHSLNKRHNVHPITEEENTEPLLDNEAHAVIVPARRSSLKGARQSTNSECDGGMSSRRGTMVDTVRPMYRDDIFFGGSLARLPQYSSRSNLGYTMSVTRLPTKEDIDEEQTHSCKLCPVSVRRTLITMLDMSLLRSPSFLLLALSGGFTMMGFFVPFMFLTQRALDNGMAESYAKMLISAIGVSNTIGRIVCGMISSHPKVNTLWVNNVAITIGGLVTIISGLSHTVGYQFIYACSFGLAISCFASLRSILLVDLVGLEKLTNAFGISLVFQGIAAAVGSPMAAAFMETTGSYDASFYLSGGLILFSGLICYPLRAVKNWEIQREKNCPV